MFNDVTSELILTHFNPDLVWRIEEVNMAFDIVSGAPLRCLQNEVMLRRIVHSEGQSRVYRKIIRDVRYLALTLGEARVAILVLLSPLQLSLLGH